MKKLFLLFILFLVGCNPAKTATRVLVMGTSAEYPPFEFRKDSKTVGFDIDLAEEIAKRLNIELEIIDMEFNALIPALQTSRVDFVMAGMTATEERKKNVHFSEIYYTNSFALLIHERGPVSGEKDLAGKKVGVQLGSTMEKIAKIKSKEKYSFDVISIAKNSVLIEELKAGRLDAVVLEKVQAYGFSKHHPKLKVKSLIAWNTENSEGYAIAFPKESKNDLAKRVSTVLEKLIQEGWIQKLNRKWLGD